MSSTLITALVRLSSALIAAALVVGTIELVRLPPFGLDPKVEDIAWFAGPAVIAGWLLAPRALRVDGFLSLAGAAGRFGCLAGGMGPLVFLSLWVAVTLLPGGDDATERNQLLATFLYAGAILAFLTVTTIVGSVVGIGWAVLTRLAAIVEGRVHALIRTSMDQS